MSKKTGIFRFFQASALFSPKKTSLQDKMFRLATFDVGVRNLALCVVSFPITGATGWTDVHVDRLQLLDVTNGVHLTQLQMLRAMRTKIRALNLDVHACAIEQQPWRGSVTMQIVAHVLALVLDEVCDLVGFMSARSKARVSPIWDAEQFAEPAKTYATRKKRAVQLSCSLLPETHLSTMHISKKKDDLADAHLMACHIAQQMRCKMQRKKYLAMI